MRRLFLTGAASIAAIATIAAVGPAAAWQSARSAAATAYAAIVNRGDGGSHILGNPAARVRLVEYVSYTCPHCAHFAADARASLTARYVTPGAVSVEIRHIVRDPIDLAMAVAANCGAPSRFFSRHDALMSAQDGILARTRGLPPTTISAIDAAPRATRLRMIADNVGVTDWMRTRGFTPAQINQCLADEGLQQRIVALSQSGANAGVDRTPTFAVNGRILPASEAYNWATLAPVLDRAVAAPQ